MKFKSLILLVVSVFVLFSCDDGIKFDNPNDINSDAYNPSDTDTQANDDDSDKDDTMSEYDDEKTDTASTNDDEPVSDDSDSDSTPDDADSIDDSGDSEPDESDSDDDSDSTDSEPDNSDSTPDEDTDTDSGDSTPDEDADTDSGDSTPDQDTDTTPTTPCDPNPCSGITNSTGSCAVSGTSYSCGCNSGYFWNGQKCAVLPECSATSGTPCKDSTSGLIWSKKAENTMAWQDAKNYCIRYTEGGFSSWHLPNIDELKTLLINADKILTECDLSETNNCLSMSNCWSCETCMETGTAATSGNTCSNWGTSYSDGRYSKFKETGWFWSSSTQSANSNNAFGISFNVGGISDYARSYDHDVRCVR